MKCNKCGNNVYGNICNNCGEHLKIINFGNTDEVIKEKNEYINLVIKAIIITSLLVFITLICLGFYNLSVCSKKEYIKFNEEKIPTIYKIIGLKEVKSYKTTKNKGRINYNVNDFTEKELQNYLNSLYKINYVEFETNDSTIGLVKKTNQLGMIVEILISSNKGELILEYNYKEDSLKNYKTVGNIKVGNDNLGYLSIPGNYESLKNKNEEIVYQNSLNKKEIIIITHESEKSLNEYTHTLLNKFLENGAENKKTNITIYNNKGYQIDSFFHNYNILRKTWIYIDDLNNIYNIRIESDNYESKIFGIIYSYTKSK
ncbi:MAG: hypothetical protein RSH78_02125 [Bacilli bacterium]